MDYGTDILLKDDNIVFTADGDVELVSGPACIAQDIDQTLKIVPGRLPWDAEAGSSMPLMLNDSESGNASIIAELERVAIEDPRVDPVSVEAYKTDEGKFKLDFTPLAAVKTETLEYDLNKEEE